MPRIEVRHKTLIEIPEWLKTILDERISEDDANPDDGSPWEEVKERILSSLSKAGRYE